MKTYVKLTVLLALFLAGCSSAYQTASVHDDIYYSRNNAEIAAEDAHQASAAVVQVNAASESKPAGNYQQPYEQNYQQEEYVYYDEPAETETYYDEQGNKYVTQNFYMDNYYDYSYSSRIRRFHRDWASFGYYDPYFTNMYWYNYDPYFYGTSIYMGYNSLFFPSFYYSWGYRPWGWAHYGYGWGYGRPWGGYWGGYNHGYWGGYHHGYWSGYYMGAYGYPYGGNYHYGNVDPTGVSYGARRPSGSTSGVGARDAGRYGSAGTKQSVSESGRIQGREQARIQASDTKDARTTASETRESVRPNNAEVSSPGQIAQRPAVESREQSGEQRRPAQYEPQRRPQDYATPSTSQQREGQAPRYTRPEQPQERSGQSAQPGERPRTYTSPSQQQPRSNQEYRRPASEQRPAATGREGQVAPQVRPQGNEPARPQATPQQRPVQTRPQAAPQRTPSQNRPQAAPQRTPQNRPQATPQRPSNNNRPQAAPSRAPQRNTPSNVRTSPSPSRGSSGNSGVRSSPPSRSSGSSSGSSSRGSSSSNRRR